MCRCSQTGKSGWWRRGRWWSERLGKCPPHVPRRPRRPPTIHPQLHGHDGSPQLGPTQPHPFQRQGPPPPSTSTHGVVPATESQLAPQQREQQPCDHVPQLPDCQRHRQHNGWEWSPAPSSPAAGLHPTTYPRLWSDFARNSG